MNIIYKLVSTTNDKFKYLEGTSGILQKDDFFNIYWFNEFHTSSIVNKKITKTKIILQTLNSVYVFKKTKETI